MEMLRVWPARSSKSIQVWIGDMTTTYRDKTRWLTYDSGHIMLF